MKTRYIIAGVATFILAVALGFPMYVLMRQRQAREQDFMQRQTAARMMVLARASVTYERVYNMWPTSLAGLVVSGRSTSLPKVHLKIPTY